MATYTYQDKKKIAMRWSAGVNHTRMNIDKCDGWSDEVKKCLILKLIQCNTVKRLNNRFWSWVEQE